MKVFYITAGREIIPRIDLLINNQSYRNVNYDCILSYDDENNKLSILASVRHSFSTII